MEVKAKMVDLLAIGVCLLYIALIYYIIKREIKQRKELEKSLCEGCRPKYIAWRKGR